MSDPPGAFDNGMSSYHPAEVEELRWGRGEHRHGDLWSRLRLIWRRCSLGSMRPQKAERPTPTSNRNGAWRCQLNRRSPLARWPLAKGAARRARKIRLTAIVSVGAKTPAKPDVPYSRCTRARWAGKRRWNRRERPGFLPFSLATEGLSVLEGAFSIELREDLHPEPYCYASPGGWTARHRPRRSTPRPTSDRAYSHGPKTQ
jgi:hypothetical protein